MSKQTCSASQDTNVGSRISRLCYEIKGKKNISFYPNYEIDKTNHIDINTKLPKAGAINDKNFLRDIVYSDKVNAVGEVIIIDLCVDKNTGFITRRPAISFATCFLLIRKKIPMCISVAHIINDQRTQLFFINFE